MPVAPEQHRRAVAAFQDLCRRFPCEIAHWLQSLAYPSRRGRAEVLHARFLEPVPRGPAYVVPPPAPPRLPTGEDRLREAMVDRAVDEAERSESAEGTGLQRIPFDVAEEARQALVEGGCDVELALEMRDPNGFEIPGLLGVPLPGPNDDGSEMSWHILGKMPWHFLMLDAMTRRCAPDVRARGPSFGFLPLYLWPGTGLLDAQEDCSVLTHDLERQVPGDLGALLRAASRDAERDRKANLERRAYHERLDRERRVAAARRRERMGHPGISDEQLSALIPAVDVEQDRITMRMTYEIHRLWEDPAEDLLEELPGELLGLALFAHRPPGLSAEELLRRCAWALRGRLPAGDAERLHEATAALAQLAAVHLDTVRVQRTLREVRL